MTSTPSAKATARPQPRASRCGLIMCIGNSATHRPGSIAQLLQQDFVVRNRLKHLLQLIDAVSVTEWGLDASKGSVAQNFTGVQEPVVWRIRR